MKIFLPHFNLIEFRFMNFKNLVFSLLFPCFLEAGGMVWKIKEAPIYIAGTLHLLKSTDFPLPPEYEEAYQATQQIYFETDLETLKKPESLAAIARSSLLPNGQNLETILSKKTVEDLKKAAVAAKIPWESISKMKPWMAATMILMHDLKKKGFEPEKGVEHYFLDRALQDRKSRGGLEIFKDHLKAMNAFDSLAIESTEQFSKEFNKTTDQLQLIINAWKSGDTVSLEKLTIEEIKATSPDLLVALLVDRNYRWVPTIKKLILLKKPTLILVGSGHLIGKENLIELLQGESLSLERLTTAPKPQAQPQP